MPNIRYNPKKFQSPTGNRLVWEGEGSIEAQEDWSDIGLVLRQSSAKYALQVDGRSVRAGIPRVTVENPAELIAALLSWDAVYRIELNNIRTQPALTVTLVA